ncbi:MAG: hypothetical protein ABIC04_06535, partial [Nanoarchaeota archaeon]
SGAVLPNWATEPTGYLDVVPENLVFLPDEESKDLTVTMHNDRYVHKYVYLYKQGNWERYELEGQTVGQSSYIDNSASATISFDRDELPAEDNYIAGWGCSKVGNQWNCHGDRWPLRSFNVEYSSYVDLALEEIQLSKSDLSISINEPGLTVINISGKNIGNIEADSFIINVSFGDSTVYGNQEAEIIIQGPVKPGERFIAQTTHYLNVGTHVITAELYSVQDENEDNNIITKQYVVEYDLPAEPPAIGGAPSGSPDVPEPGCSETDNHQDYLTKGNCTDDTGTVEDECSTLGLSIYEKYCTNSQGECASKTMSCEDLFGPMYRCVQGACVDTGIETDCVRKSMQDNILYGQSQSYKDRCKSKPNYPFDGAECVGSVSLVEMCNDIDVEGQPLVLCFESIDINDANNLVYCPNGCANRQCIP